VAVLMVIFTLVILALEMAVSYRRYAKVLKWLTVSLLAYPITAFLVHEPSSGTGSAAVARAVGRRGRGRARPWRSFAAWPAPTPWRSRHGSRPAGSAGRARDARRRRAPRAAEAGP
jgi:hypothetical protein